MLVAKNLSLVKISCKIKGKDLEWTSMNSYIFQSEIKSSFGKYIQLGLFVPKI